MKWRDQKSSSNIDDRRFQKTPASMVNLQVLIPLIRWLLRTKFGRVILLIGVVAMFLGYNPLALISGGGVQNAQISKDDDKYAQFIGVVLAQTENVWNKQFQIIGKNYKEPKLVLFRGAVQSGCGFANSQVGPFYCPADQKIYIDLSFFDELANRHNAPGDFANAYVLAHEVGHHVQNLLGILSKANKEKQGKNEKDQNAIQVKVELGADCLAGVWAHYLGDILEDGDIDEALNAASMIGDDTLQKQANGYVVPDSFTHGSAIQRKNAFYKGYKSGDISICKF
ncbi:neutral zinc metallopeptidase [Campylobacter ureolyticus]|uniref:Zinc metallopeptidase n=1 Tax=Campylobacter ureolyticus TaxID=827 RepID=A0A9Q4KLW4_9BACT|nr:neutral zinc metallopeptidase [Campylobacter ureolyticus]MCZ6160425.1 zinc metallopeptidase [Campylobacter ureolyticus]MCZ6164133.1 zinc metallopeptidase [Campylobacter ureolyticus]MCZ6165742.1 zinc metallopeptidase [Campylobacter ureolyticus]MCZ6175037.1 zinc metallopeptidase [Campylobacter ureolyticus]MCZ6186954.1 zinc metallopeptidase [Campylobacter ureolyticus]